jgi:succinylglutamic semialdehyde dehydrogenase
MIEKQDQSMSNASKGQFIGGQWGRLNGQQLTSENPATGDVIWTGEAADLTAVAQAVGAARQAFSHWRLLSFAERNSFVDRFIERLKAREEELAQAIHVETGKPLWESKTEIGTMVAKAAISVKAYDQRTGTTEQDNNGMRVLLAHRPIGAFAVLGPYNFPGHLPNGHIIPALLAGNTVVFKPSELTPQFGELMIECWEQAGLPAGVVNLVQGGRETGEALVNSPDINGVLFTGVLQRATLFIKPWRGSHRRCWPLRWAAITRSSSMTWLISTPPCTQSCSQRLSLPGSAVPALAD